MGKPKVEISSELASQKVVHFDGYSQLYSNLNFGALLDEYTLLALVRHTGGSNQSVIASIGTDWIFGLGNEKSAFWQMGSSLLSNSPAADDDWHLMSGSVNQNGEVKLWRDSFLMYDGMRTSTEDYKPRSLSLGGSQANELYSNAEIAEVLLYNRSLKDSERINLEDHLRLKWFANGLVDFPVLVRLSTGQHPDFNLNTFADSESASDLRFFGSKGEELPYEIDEWNTSTGESTLWVQTPKVSTDLKITAYWGNESNVTAPDYRENGSTWTDYDGVWHFSDYSDATSYTRNATASGSPETNATGISGSSILLDGINDQTDDHWV